MKRMPRFSSVLAVAAAWTVLGGVGWTAWAQDEGGPPEKEKKDEKPDFPPYAEVTKGYEKVVSTADGQASFYTVLVRSKDNQVLAELPRNFERQKLFVATTVAAGDPFAGIQFSDGYLQWRRLDKRLLLIAPNTAVKSTGDAESKQSASMIYTDTVVLDVPIVTMGPGGGPVIDLDEMLLGQSEKFFGEYARGARRNLARVAKAKAFPQNIELAFELPAREGQLVTLYYSLSELVGTPGYQPREADSRVGYFVTGFRDISRNDKDTQFVRYINRWHLEKADPKLKMSPPKQPIVFYIDHRVPNRYRRWVRDGILAWNRAFEKVGLVNAIEVYQQDATTGAHMDKDPEDVRYNFVRWSTGNMGFAIGPSRAHPETGEILDADVVLDDGFIRGFVREYQELLPSIAMTGFAPETVSWLDNNPDWDPRVLLAAPDQRDRVIAEIKGARARADAALAAEPTGSDVPAAGLRVIDPGLLGPGGTGLGAWSRLRHDHSGRYCACIQGKAMDVGLMRIALDAGVFEMLAPEGGSEADMLDGVPEWYIGPSLKDLVMHEVGHTLGLRHNFRASTIHTVKDLNSDTVKGKAAMTGSVMDYNPVNINAETGPIQGDYCMMDIGPYDMWVIEYGYTLEKDLKPILARVAEPLLTYATDEDISGPDPVAKQFDLGADSLDWADNQMRLVRMLRPKLLDRVVKDGDGWWKARRGYTLLLGQHIGAVRVASYWIGGATVNRDKKGDPNMRDPVVPVDPARQRRAIKTIIENTFRDEAFGLTPDLLAKLTVDRWWDDGSAFQDPGWPVHDQILGIQGSALTMVINPTTLRRVYDNEFRVPADKDALTVPEVLDTLTTGVWTELDAKVDRTFTNRQPMISSMRRNLQRAHLDRLVALSTGGAWSGAAAMPLTNVVVQTMVNLKDRIDGVLKNVPADRMDAYTRAHLADASLRIQKALDARFTQMR